MCIVPGNVYSYRLTTQFDKIAFNIHLPLEIRETYSVFTLTIAGGECENAVINKVIYLNVYFSRE